MLPVQKIKSHSRGRVLGQRKCPCGQIFVVYTKHPDQQTCGKFCRNQFVATQRRVRKFKAELTRLRSVKGSLSAVDLVDLLQRTWLEGYRAGWKAPHRILRP